MDFALKYYFKTLNSGKRPATKVSEEKPNGYGINNQFCTIDQQIYCWNASKQVRHLGNNNPKKKIIASEIRNILVGARLHPQTSYKIAIVWQLLSNDDKRQIGHVQTRIALVGHCTCWHCAPTLQLHRRQLGQSACSLSHYDIQQKHVYQAKGSTDGDWLAKICCF